jgi:hypothetical protein
MEKHFFCVLETELTEQYARCVAKKESSFLTSEQKCGKTAQNENLPCVGSGVVIP